MGGSGRRRDRGAVRVARRPAAPDRQAARPATPARSAKFAQGLLFGPPVPAGEVTALLDRLGVHDGDAGWPAAPGLTA